MRTCVRTLSGLLHVIVFACVPYCLNSFLKGLHLVEKVGWYFSASTVPISPFLRDFNLFTARSTFFTLNTLVAKTLEQQMMLSVDLASAQHAKMNRKWMSHDQVADVTHRKQCQIQSFPPKEIMQRKRTCRRWVKFEAYERISLLVMTTCRCLTSPKRAKNGQGPFWSTGYHDCSHERCPRGWALYRSVFVSVMMGSTVACCWETNQGFSSSEGQPDHSFRWKSEHSPHPCFLPHHTDNSLRLHLSLPCFHRCSWALLLTKNSRPIIGLLIVLFEALLASEHVLELVTAQIWNFLISRYT